MRAKINFENGLPHGAAEFYDSTGQINEKGVYDKGFKKGEWQQFNDGKPSQMIMDLMKRDTTPSMAPGLFQTDVESVVESMPEFPGGEMELLKYLGRVKYPAVAREKDIEGTVFIRFVVNQMGEVIDVEIAKGAHEILNEVSLQHVKTFPRWRPGLQRGVPVKVQYIVPIKFRLA